MKRRDLFGGAATLAGVLACPAWMARAFAQDDDGGLAALSEAYRRAQRAGRPLLVIVIPAQREARWERAGAFGELLNHGPDQVFVDLALAEVVCATMSTLRTLVPQAPAGEPLMVLVEPERVPAVARAIDATLPETPEYWIFRDDEQMSFEERTARENEVIDRRIAALASLVHGAIAPDDAALQRRASVALAALPVDRRQRIELALGVYDTSDRVAVALAPALFVRHPAFREAVRDVGIERWRRGRVPGSRWAIGSGCGTTVEMTEEERRREGDASLMIACGMGHVPERSARFLDWYLTP
ncbi:hypothetical protein [Sandaracinus amylolyticus]|uniref:Uncharacterized protein n=1 Tax=Sandaracinus amylolyticus TaxID=927083 RepID=A0A0F6SFL5_9BACT|nr:hypothetical protein [Sandaracinus amylolyticus]AKF07154.1 hypothetical protein DB32_004303 [Sandaracinus amylolyticus]